MIYVINFKCAPLRVLKGKKNRNRKISISVIIKNNKIINQGYTNMNATPNTIGSPYVLVNFEDLSPYLDPQELSVCNGVLNVESEKDRSQIGMIALMILSKVKKAVVDIIESEIITNP